MQSSETEIAAATAWLIRTREQDFADWLEFTAWLESNERHNAAYEAALALDEVAGEVSRTTEPGVALPQFRWRTYAVAAAVVAAIGAVGFSVPNWRHAQGSRVVATGLGQRTSVRLADGSEIALNGDSRIVLLDGRDARRVRLDRGEASFAVRHDPASPFEVEVGGAIVRDVGTHFDITRDTASTEIGIAEGAVLYQPDGAAIRLTAGQQLRSEDGSDRLILTRIDPGSIGAWREGRLIYRDAALTEVAADLARTTGVRVDLGPGLGSRRFSGVIALGEDSQAQLFPRVAALLDLSVRHASGGWQFESRALPAR